MKSEVYLTLEKKLPSGTIIVEKTEFTISTIRNYDTLSLQFTIQCLAV
jgi:hypothetical protein